MKMVSDWGRYESAGINRHRKTLGTELMRDIGNLLTYASKSQKRLIPYSCGYFLNSRIQGLTPDEIVTSEVVACR